MPPSCTLAHAPGGDGGEQGGGGGDANDDDDAAGNSPGPGQQGVAQGTPGGMGSPGGEQGGSEQGGAADSCDGFTCNNGKCIVATWVRDRGACVRPGQASPNACAPWATVPVGARPGVIIVWPRLV